MSLGFDPSTKRYKQHLESVPGTKKDTEKRLSELLHQLDTGSFMEPGKTTVADFLQRWLSDYVKPNLSPRTFEGYEYIIRYHVIPSLMLKNGVHPKIVQERLGHSTIAITLDTYSHVSPGLQQAAAQKFDDLLKLGHNVEAVGIH